MKTLALTIVVLAAAVGPACAGQDSVLPELPAASARQLVELAKTAPAPTASSGVPRSAAANCPLLQLTFNETAENVYPRVTRDGKSILYIQGWRDLYRMNLDGTGKRKLASFSDGSTNWLEVSDDPKTAFVKGKPLSWGNGSGIYQINLETNEMSDIGILAFWNARNPARIPRSDWEAVSTAEEPGNLEWDWARIFLINRHLGEKRLLTPGRGDHQHPIATPDGKKIIFLSQAPGRGDREIHIMNLDGSGRRSLFAGGDTHEFSITPDGQRIVFASERGNSYQIYSMCLPEASTSP